MSQIQSKLSEEKLDAILLLDPYNVFYASGFFHQSTERPLGLLIPQIGEPSLYVPKLEQEMASDTWIKSIHVYFDFNAGCGRGVYRSCNRPSVLSSLPSLGCRCC